MTDNKLPPADDHDASSRYAMDSYFAHAMETTQEWLDASNIAIQLFHEGRMLEDPAIVCTRCGDTLTILADMDTVAALMTLAAEHRCRAEAEEPEPEPIPMLAVGNSEPLPDHLPEELRAILRTSRRQAGWCDHGHRTEVCEACR